MNLGPNQIPKHCLVSSNSSSQVPKSYKAPVFLEELVAGLSDQVKLEK